jgi:CheY-like chemotaxis protein
MSTVLIVEDNLSVAKFYALALERGGQIRCLRGSSAEEVLELARAGRVDLALVDVSLVNFTYQGRPIDGLELSRLLKNDPRTCHLPVLLATAHAMEGDYERFLAASGADDCLQKPIYEPQVLVGKVQSLLERANGLKGSTPR